MLNKVKELVGVEASEETQEVKLAQATLENGTVIESETFEAGSEVFIVTEEEKVALPIGEYTLEDGEILTVEEEAPAEEEATEEVKAEEDEQEMAYATKEELAEVKSMIEEIKAMIEKEEMSEEGSSVKSEETTTKVVYSSKEEMSEQEPEKVKHNPEAVADKQLNLLSKNKRGMSTMDRVLQRMVNNNK